MQVALGGVVENGAHAARVQPRYDRRHFRRVLAGHKMPEERRAHQKAEEAGAEQTLRKREQMHATKEMNRVCKLKSMKLKALKQLEVQ